MSPRQLRKRYPDLSPAEAAKLSLRLRRDELRRRSLLASSSVMAAAPAAAVPALSPRDRQAVKAAQPPTPKGLTA